MEEYIFYDESYEEYAIFDDTDGIESVEVVNVTRLDVIFEE